MSVAGSGQVKSALRTLDIIEFATAHERPFAAQDLAISLGIPVSSLSYLLGTLVERNYLERDGRRYRAGPALRRLRVYKGEEALHEKIAPFVRSLRMQLNETSSFFVRTGWEAEAIITETGDQPLRYAVDVNTRVPLYALAAGKGLLSALADDELSAYLDEIDLRPLTPQTVTDKHRLRAEIEAVRESGIARSTAEFSPGIAAIARVVSKEGRALGALSVAVPLVRFDQTLERRVVDLLKRTAALLSGI